jgi:hypothetical protein
MPVGGSDSCLSTVWCRATCVMLKTRPAQRITGERSISRTAHHPDQKSAPRNGFHYTEAACDARWWIRRMSEHHMLSGNVCNGQDPTRSTYYGRETDI